MNLETATNPLASSTMVTPVRPGVRFALRLVVFALPLVLLLGGLLAVTFSTGELLPAATVVQRQIDNPLVLYGPSDSKRVFAYKLVGLNMRRPEVVIFGSSRVMPYRAEILSRKPEAFFNAGSTSWELEELSAFVAALTEDNAPPILLIGVDQFWFNEQNPIIWRYGEQPFLHPPVIDDVNEVFRTARNVLGETLRLEYIQDGVWQRFASLTEPLYHHPASGIIGISRGIGYRSDGSIQRGPRSADPNLTAGDRARHLAAVQDTVGAIYGTGDHVSEEKLALLATALDRLDELGVQVVGFAPPYAPAIYDAMMSDGRHGYFQEALTRINTLFDGHQFAFVDISDAAQVGGTDEEMYDGSHVGERMMLRTYLHLLDEVPEILAPYSDREVLQHALDEAPSAYYVFDPLP